MPTPTNARAWWLFCQVDHWARIILATGLGSLDHDKVWSYAERVHGWETPDPDTEQRLQICSMELLKLHNERHEKSQREAKERAEEMSRKHRRTWR